MKVLLLLILSAVVMAAQQAKDEPKPPAPAPVLKPVALDIESEFYQADSAIARFTPVWEAANKRLQEAADAITKACPGGAIFLPGMQLPNGKTNDTKHILCGEAPKPASK